MRPHFPECYLYEHDDVGHFDESECDKDCVGPCICGRLRACEQRVREEHATEWQTEQEEIHVLGLNLAYRKGLDAAREAVAALPMMKIAGNFPLYDADDALAAIDALRGDQQ